MVIGNILEDILAERQSRMRACALGRWLHELPADDRAKVEAALGSKTDGQFTVKHTELADHLGRAGFKTTEYMVGDHRRGSCACGKGA